MGLTEEWAPDTFTLNGIGKRFVKAEGEACHFCGSKLFTLYFCIFWIPFMPLDNYRILKVNGGGYIGLKVKEEE